MFEIFLSWLVIHEGESDRESDRPIGSRILTALLLSFLDPRSDWVQSKFLSNLEFLRKYLFLVMFKGVLITMYTHCHGIDNFHLLNHCNHIIHNNQLSFCFQVSHCLKCLCNNNNESVWHCISGISFPQMPVMHGCLMAV